MPRQSSSSRSSASSSESLGDPDGTSHARSSKPQQEPLVPLLPAPVGRDDFLPPPSQVPRAPVTAASTTTVVKASAAAPAVSRRGGAWAAQAQGLSHHRHRHAIAASSAALSQSEGIRASRQGLVEGPFSPPRFHKTRLPTDHHGHSTTMVEPQQQRKMSQQRDLFQELAGEPVEDFAGLGDPFRLPLGSFADDSPVREGDDDGHHYRRREGGKAPTPRSSSPPRPIRHDTHHHHPYRQPPAPPYSWAQGQGKQGYQYTFGHQPTPFSWGPGQHHHHQHHPTTGEPASAALQQRHSVPAAAAPPRSKQRDSSPLSVRHSPSSAQQKSAPPPRETTSPAKHAASRGAQQLFRSPTVPFHSRQGDRSAHIQGSPPTIGTYGSFGVDTPQGGTMGDDLSPMEPGFEESFTRDTSFLPNPQRFLQHESPAFSDYWQSCKAASRGVEPSSTEFLRSFSPMAPSGATLRPSPPPPYNERSSAYPPPPPMHPSTTEPFPFARSELPRMAPPAPLARPPEVQSPARRQLYSEPSPQPPGSAMRLELRNQPASTQRALAGINSKMQQAQKQQAPTMPPYGQPPHFRFSRLPPPYRPIHPYPAASQLPHPMSSRLLPHMGFTSTGQQNQSPPPVLPRPPHRANDAEQPSQVVDGKENSSTSRRAEPSDPLRSGGCHCKKSRCLKLYCECFAAEIFCLGCKCRDCHNTLEYASARSRAMLEIKSKNPEAFKPRVETTHHNMGCRCKKSECLKKYCECFEAKVLCSSKCKCTGCMNQAGSQKLIDKRRKMKDVVGAEFAMKVAETTWKAQLNKKPPAKLLPHRPTPPVFPRPGSTPHPPFLMPSVGPGPHPQYLNYLPQSGVPPPRMGYSPMVGPSPNFGPPLSSEISRATAAHFEKGTYPPSTYYPGSYPPPHFGGSAYHGRVPWQAHDSTESPHLGAAERSFDPRIQATTPVASSRALSQEEYDTDRTSIKRITPSASSLKAPPPSATTPSKLKPSATNLAPKLLPKRPMRHPSSVASAKKSKTEGRDEAEFPFFGPSLPNVPIRVALFVFSYLSEDERFKASLVSKHWKFATRRKIASRKLK